VNLWYILSNTNFGLSRLSEFVLSVWKLPKVPDIVSELHFGITHPVHPVASCQNLTKNDRMVTDLNRCPIEGLTEAHNKGFRVLSASQAFSQHWFAVCGLRKDMLG
jgi:hypothetical protein